MELLVDIVPMKSICLCGVCREMLYEGDKLADHKVFAFDGNLKYIELAHEDCALADNITRKLKYWEIG